MENEQELTPQQSIALIESMINKVKTRVAENGFLYLLWGWVIFSCALIQFLVLKFQIAWFSHPEIVWLSTIVVLIIQIIYLIKKDKEKRVESYFDEIIKNVWMTFGICMGIMSFIISKFNIWEFAYPLVLMMYGIPTFLSGFAMKFTPLKIGAVGCWILAIVATFVQPIDYLLIIALAMTIAWIIPGHLMRAKFKKDNGV